jgi:hypothetical protein
MTGYKLDVQSSIPVRDRIFSLCCHVQNGSGAHPDFYPVCMWRVGGAFSPRLKRLEHKADYSRLSTAEV